MFELVSPGTHIDFIGRWKIAALGSVLVIAIGMAASPFRLQMGIDFAGGWEIQVRFDDSTTEEQIRDTLSPIIADVGVVRFGSDREFLIRFAVQPGEDPTQAQTPTEEAAGAAQREIQTEPEAEESVEEAQPLEEAEEEEEALESSEAEAAASEGESVAGGEETGADDPASAAEEKADQGFTQGQRADRIREQLRETIGPVSLERVEFVGPRVGAELRRAGLLSLLIAGAMILVYISFRFTFRFAPGAIVALLHDVLLTSSIWVLMGREFNLQVLAALLAIVGYSLNDTIIVYDRIRENMELRTTTDLPEVLNRSINQTLSRTVLTSVTTLLAVLSLLTLGGEVIRPFATAMAIGIGIGTYSSVFIAAPVLLWLETRHSAAAAT